MNTDLKDKLTEGSGQYANDKNACAGPIGDRHGGNGTGFRHLCLSVFTCGFLALCVLGVSVVKCQAGWQTGPAVSGGGGGTATNATLNVYTTNLTGVADAHVETLTVAGATSAVDAATATNALNLGGVNANGYAQNLSQGLGLWISAQQALYANPTATNGQKLPVLDYSGHWGVTNGAQAANPATFSPNGINGFPAFYFNANSSMAVSNFWVDVTNFTMEITFMDPTPDIGFSLLFSGAAGNAGSGLGSLFLQPWIDNGGTVSGGEAAGYTGGAMYLGLNTLNGDQAIGEQQAVGMAHVVTLSFDSSNVWATMDDKPCSIDTRIQWGAGEVGVLAGCTNLFIGSGVGGSYFSGYISDFRIYTNTYSAAWEHSLENYCCQQANIPVNTINWVGDSISQGLHAWALLGNEEQILAPNFPNWLINTEAESGRTSAQDTNAVSQWVTFKTGGLNIARVLVGVNDFNPGDWSGANAIAIGQSNQVPVTFYNISNICATLSGNGIPTVVGTLPSACWETNTEYYFASGFSWRTNLNAKIWTLTNIQNVFVADYGSAAIGTNSAFTNAVYFNADGLHPNSAGYTNMALVSAPVLSYVCKGITAETVPTNLAPFSLALPLTDSYQGHTYYNSNQTWMILK